jgi:hypothetical protein
VDHSHLSYGGGKRVDTTRCSGGALLVSIVLSLNLPARIKMIKSLRYRCGEANPTYADIREYFWSLVDKNGSLPDPATGVRSKCWLWLGSVTDQCYGRFKAGGEIYMATRFSWKEMASPTPVPLRYRPAAQTSSASAT